MYAHILYSSVQQLRRIKREIKMLLTNFCKKESSAYDKLQNEDGYFDSNKAQLVKKATSSSVKKYTYNNIPQTAEFLVDRLAKDVAMLNVMTDSFGKEIKEKSIVKLTAFLIANNISF